MQLPPAIYELLSDIVPRIMRGEEIVLIREDKPLTTQQAADLLGMSRPFLKRLLDEEQIPLTAWAPIVGCVLRMSCATRNAVTRSAVT